MAAEPVEFATARQNTFATLFTLINDNKLSGWTVKAAFPEDNTSFPCIVLNPALVKPTILGLDSSCIAIEDIEVEVEFYSLAEQGKDQNDQGRDNVQTTILNNASTLSTNNLVINEDPFDDSNADSFIIGEQKINTSSSIIKLSKK